MVEIECLPLREPAIGRLLGALKDGGDSPFEIAVVMPTARGIRHLVRAMGGSAPGPVCLPYLFEMNEFCLRCLAPGGYRIVPDELRLPYLQKAVRGLEGRRLLRLFGPGHERYCSDFLRFLSVGRRLLRFYDELFTEGVRFEDLRMNALYTDYEKDVAVLQEIASLYSEGLASDGLTDVVFLKGRFLEGSPAVLDPSFPARFRKVYFLLSGRLSRFELKLLQALSEVTELRVFVQYEGPPEEEIKGLCSLLGADTPPELPPAPYPASVHVEGFDLAEEQVSFVMESLLKVMEMGVRAEEVVVVLPDEGLKKPLYASDREGVLNFAMGLDLKDSVFYSLLKSMEEMLSARSDDGRFHAEAVLRFLGHPFIRATAGRAYEGFVRYVKGNQRLLFRWDELLLTPELKEVFKRIDRLFSGEVSFRELLEGLQEFTRWVMELNPGLVERLGESPEFIGARKAFFERLSQLAALPYHGIMAGGRPLGHLAYLNDLLKGLTYPHTWGGPVTVMGMLETRALGFKAVIIPDMNEEFMPPSSEKEMFLNTEIRRRVGLPTYLDREALSRTYFNGLIKRADVVFLGYAATEGRRPRSRFIEEMAMAGCRITERARPGAGEGPPPLNPLKSSTPVKDSRTLELINAMEFTPTSLRTYKECRFRFYLRYIKRLGEREELTTRLRRVDIGRIFHSAVRRLYRSCIDGSGVFQPPSWDLLAERLRKEVLREAGGYDVFSRSSHARLELETFLEKLKEFIGSERELFEAGWRPAHLELPVGMVLKGARFRGRIDRVDLLSEGSDPARAVIIDYKVSDVEVRERTVLDGEFTELQLPLYRLMLKETVEGIDVEGLAYYDLKRRFRLVRVFEDLSDREFRLHIEELLAELRDRGTGFDRTAKEKNCRHCPYIDLCR